MAILYLFLVILIGYIDNTVSVEISSCYGNIDNLLTPVCNSDEIIRLNGLYAVAKKTATGCSQTYTSFSDPGYPQRCCTYNGEDCKMDYTGVSEYFKPCVAKYTCSMLVAWQDTTCRSTGFLARSNYMIMDYRCVAVGDILPITSDGTQSGTTPTLGGPDYPNSTLPANTGGICSVTASCGTTINVIAVDVNFQTDGGGTCKQYIDIEESGSNRRRIDCVDNNDQKPRVLYSSQTHFLILRYNNTLSTDAGDLWLEFNGTHGDATIEIRCGTSIQTTSPSVPGCASTVAPSVPTSSGVSPLTNSPGRGPLREEDPAMSGGQIAAIIIAIILLLLALFIILLWRHKKKKTGKVGDKERLDEYGEDGLPVYPYGTKPEMITSRRPNQTLLRPAKGDDTGKGTPKQPPLIKSLKTFDQVQRRPSSLAGPLPLVRAPPRPVQDISNNNYFVEHPFAPMVNHDKMEIPAQANGPAVFDGEESHSKPHKKKKKHKKSESENDEHGKKKKKKKKSKHKDDEEPVDQDPDIL